MKKHNLVITTAAVLLCWAAVGVTTLAQHEGHGRQKPSTQDNQQRPEMRRQCGKMERSMPMPNHSPAMAYLQNMAALTKLLRDQVQQCGSVNGDFARDVTAEIWRSFDQLDRYRQKQMDMTQGGMQTVAIEDHSSMAANAPSEYLALREIGAERGALTPSSPAFQGKTNLQMSDQSGDHTHMHTSSQMNNWLMGQMTEMMRRIDACLKQLSARLIELERETSAANPSPKWVLEHTNAILRLLDEVSAMHGGSNVAK